MNIIKSLLQFSGDNFEVWESYEGGLTYYNISIEGNIGYENFESSIELYESFLKQLEEYLKNNYPKSERNTWKCLYRTRAIEVCYESDCFWIFLEPFKSTEIWDLYYYIQDVIKQLEEIKNKINAKDNQIKAIYI